jgi:hypothetical protein
MTSYDWQPFLQRWSHEWLEDSDFRAMLPPDVLASAWLGGPGAPEAELAGLEARLGMSLPPSYRAFLTTTNGWRRTTSRMEQLWSTYEVEWFRVRHQDWIDIWLEESEGLPPIRDDMYFVYGPGQDPIYMRAEYLLAALEIGAPGDYESAIYLLNPQVITPEGEWEAWLLATWLPGASRHPSFWDMMQAEHEKFIDWRQQEAR